MLLANNPIVGTIRIEPSGAAAYGRRSDDSTLESLLESFASTDSLTGENEDCEPLHIVATRFNRCWPDPPAPSMSVQANLVQLVDDLQSEYARLSGCLIE